MEHTTNHILLRGTMQTMPAFSHDNHGREFYRFLLEVPRLSGISDILPVIVGKEQLESLPLSVGCTVTVSGQIRSHNVRTDGKRHLLIFVFAATVICDAGEAVNSCILTGILCREPVFRHTPLGREICDIMLAVPRTFKRADYLPCILWGKTARDAALCRTRDRIQISGRLQSRIYTKLTESGSEKRTAYEISVLEAQLSPNPDSGE